MPRFPSLFLHPLTEVRCAFFAIAQAGHDAGRAWIISPARFARSFYGPDESGGVRLRHRRPFRRRELLKLKMLTARDVFFRSLALGFARTVRIPRRPTEGLLANLLHVIEVLHRVRPDARVYVDWVLTGAEQGFRYGGGGDDVWAQLFLAIGPRLPKTAHRVEHSIDFAFWGTGKDRLRGRSLARHRRAYHATVSKWLRISNEQVRERVRHTCQRFPTGCFRIGVHRRVGNVRVADLQHDGKVPSLQDFVMTVQLILKIQGRPDHVIFLATDDAEAVTVFKDTFGSRLVLQDQVQRTTADLGEVHFRDWNQLSIVDAVDVLTDTILLSYCDVLVHASSSISTFASVANPDLVLMRVSATDPSSSATGYTKIASPPIGHVEIVPEAGQHWPGHDQRL
ncbi:MAG: hypothetical protein ABI224_05650 [Acetobacteraceae bacterium]